ncbi:dienelactone hydrolase family protein [Paenibacillus sp.]|uniref:dienelactone hydrolase family protein n=1 Tax=Paenibacillus sp. TaxID=58172 RepID=UPI002D5C30C9|nr:dienelactone hydrolase family protein [Paenibacillus sp.]HZG87774.1 dienelactone hydrolase family protein [Paenibacillus sp.]
MNVNEDRKALMGLLELDQLPDVDAPLRIIAREAEERDDYVLERLTLDLNGLEPVSALLALPKDRPGPFPAVVFNHSHGGNYKAGKIELIEGASYLDPEPYAKLLTSLGFAALATDAWGFGDRFTRKESELFKEMLWRGRVLWGMMLYDSMRAVSYLRSRDDIDASRIGTLGMSMGGTKAWWLTALDERIAFCADLCGAADYDALIEERRLDYHGIYYYVPKLLTRFSSGDIQAMGAPRPRLCAVGVRDPLTPGVDRFAERIAQAYREADAEHAWRLRQFDAGHEETAEMRGAVRAFLRSFTEE